MRVSSSLTTCLLLALVNVVNAELPQPRLDRIQPLGGMAGSEVHVICEGQDLDGIRGVICDHSGIHAELIQQDNPQRVQIKLRIDTDVPVGTYDLFLWGRFGLTNPRVWQVSRGLNEILEQEPNHLPEQAQLLDRDVVINGVSDQNQRDLYRWLGRAGEHLIVSCWSARLETEMDAQLQLIGPQGQVLAVNRDYFGRDPFIDQVLPQDGTYIVEVRDLTYRGNYPYRLHIHRRAHVEQLFPVVVRAEEQVALKVYGYNLDGEASSWSVGKHPWQQRELLYTPPRDLSALGAFPFRVHPLQHSVLPTAATSTLIGEQWMPFDAGPVTLLITNDPVVVEAESNDQRERAQPLALPCMVSGRFDQPRDADWYLIETDHEGGNYACEVYAERLAGYCDPYVMLFDEMGNTLAHWDDYGHRWQQFDAHLRDPVGQINLPPNKKFWLLVQDRYQRGGARYVYALKVRKAKPNFFVATMTPQPQPMGLSLGRGGAAWLDVIVHHFEGAQTVPITITAEGLPEGVRMSPITITNDMKGTLVFEADDQAPLACGPFRLWADAQVGSEKVRHIIRQYTRSFPQVGSRPVREGYLAVRETAPFRLSWENPSVTVMAGDSVRAKLRLHRLWEDHQAPVNYQSYHWPGGLQMNTGIFDSHESVEEIEIRVDRNLAPGLYSLVVMAQSQVPFHKDLHEKQRPLTLVSSPSPPLQIHVIKTGS